MYRFGKGTDRDYYEARRWYKKGAEAGSIISQHNYGMVLVEGIGGPKYRYEGLDWLRKAAQQGYALAVTQLGRLLCNPIGTTAEERIEGFRWLTLGAVNDPECQYLLAMAYLMGTGTELNQRLAAEQLERAADSGHAAAAYNLARILFTGDGIPKDVDKAIELYSLAANNDFGLAQFALAEIYSDPDFSGRDYAKAIHWYEKRAQAGSSMAKFELDVLRQIHESQKRERQSPQPPE